MWGHVVTALVIFLFSLELQAKENKVVTKASRGEDSYWSLLLPSFVVHGIKPDSGVEQDMPRKMDAGGITVMTPGVGLEYRGDDGFVLLGALVKDCYDNFAGTLQVGQSFKLGRRTEMGYTLGVYVRQTPLWCETTTTMIRGMAVASTECYSADNLGWGYTMDVGQGTIDIIPSPFLNFTTEIFRGSFAVNLKVLSNFYLNEVGLSIPF